MIRVYTGAIAAGSAETGGWAAIVVGDQGMRNSFWGGERDATPNRIELKAAIEGLLRTPPGCEATVFTRSLYLIENARSSPAGDPCRDQWAVLERLVSRRAVTWEWVGSTGENLLSQEALHLAHHAAGLRTPPLAVSMPPGASPSPLPPNVSEPLSAMTAARIPSWAAAGRGTPPGDTAPQPYAKQDASPRPATPAPHPPAASSASGSSEEPAPDRTTGYKAGDARQEAPVEQAKSSAEKRQSELTHLDRQGNAHMVDVSGKADTDRVAVAHGRVVMKRETLDLIRTGQAAKGDVLSAARIAGIMAAKQTANLIPLCHPLLLTRVDVDFTLDPIESAVNITATARTTGKTGVEMEALTAVSISALTIYDMCKAVDRGMRIEGIRLARKSGGKSGEIILE